jgi:hypothetical protein
MDPIEGKLRKRYGQDRFNPAEGQTDMTYREWLDRHPALNANEEAATAYLQATGKKHPTLNPGGLAMQGQPAKSLGDFLRPTAAPTRFTGGGPDTPPLAERAKASASRKKKDRK